MTYKAVPNTPNLLEALLLQVRNRLLDDRINILESMRIITIGSLCQPTHEIKAFRLVETHWVTIEQVNNKSIVSIGGELICHQLAILPDGDDIRKV
jgi:hypothetical protein